jgi:hypothetical protein
MLYRDGEQNGTLELSGLGKGELETDWDEIWMHLYSVPRNGP